MNNTYNIHIGDNQLILPKLPDNSVDSIVTDPPYELGFMGKTWDATGIAYNVQMWRECLRVLKPGGHLLAFSGSRTYHRMAVAIEDAGFQIRDQIMWVYGSGFPKSLNISKAIDKAAGAEREIIGSWKPQGTARLVGGKNPDGIFTNPLNAELKGELPITAPATAEAKEWDGWGTALKPAHEPIVLARKPLDGTVANNVLTHGVGGLNIDGCRVGMSDEDFAKLSAGVEAIRKRGGTMENSWKNSSDLSGANPANAQGRFPANFIHDGSDEVLELFPSDKPDQSAARFFYCAKANKKDRNEGLESFTPRIINEITPPGTKGSQSPRAGAGRNGATLNHHPTVKPTELMRYLCRLVTPPNGVVLDPFTGSGSTGKAALLEGFNFIGIEQSEEYAAIAKARIEHVAPNE